MSDICGHITKDGITYPVYRAFANVTAGQTDSSLVAAVSDKSILVLSLHTQAAGTATTFVLNSKPSGAGVAISPVFSNPANSGASVPYNPHGHYITTAGEGLTCTTGAGSTTAVSITYALLG